MQSSTETLTDNGAKAGSKNRGGVGDIVGEMSDALELAIGRLRAVNAETKMLSLNATVEAARAGSSGTAFGVVAREMQNLSDKTANIAKDMSGRNREITAEMTELIDSFRGTRLSDLALVNIDLIDRNLYERTCDVRWWATDGSVVDALASPVTERLDFACQRLGIILEAYTVYHDLVLCDSRGEIVANGRKSDYRSVGKNSRTTRWFRQANASASGNEYGFESAHNNELVNDQPTLVYSCSVRRDGLAHGQRLGVLGAMFNWSELADPILANIPIEEHERDSTESYILDENGCVLASSVGLNIGEKLPLPDFDKVVKSPKGFFTTKWKGNRVCIGHAKAPGFETYSTGWYSLIIQRWDEFNV
ncbi:MAG: methyl-accepting chemotaxis protein [Planctomycetota bacterium]